MKPRHKNHTLTSATSATVNEDKIDTEAWHLALGPESEIV